MNTDGNKALYRRFIQEIFNEGRLDALTDLVSPDYVLREAPPGTPAGPDAIRQIVTMFRAGFPDLTVSIEALIAEGDLVCARAVTRGTHRGAFFGVPPTGKIVAMPGLTMVRIADGRLMESWVKNDVAGLMAQLGAAPRER